MTALNAAGQGRARPGSVLSAARTIGDAVGRKNGRQAVAPSIAVPDGSAAAAAARRERALERLLNPLLDGADGEGDGEGDMQPETTAFAGLPPDQQLPPHPPLRMMLRDEDPLAATKQLARFGGARGSHRGMAAWKVLAREKLRVASLVQQRETGAQRLHAMLRAHASAFSSLVYSSYSTGIVSDALLSATDNASIYTLLAYVFSKAAILYHCRKVEARAELVGLKPSSLHVHFTHAAMLSNLADAASTTLMGPKALAASGAGVREVLAAKARLQRKDGRRGARLANTIEAAVAACGAIPSPDALGALLQHATATVVAFGSAVGGLCAPHGCSPARAREACVALALVLALPRGLRLGDMQGLTFALLEPAVRPVAVSTPRSMLTRALPRRHCCVNLSRANGKTANGADSGFGAADGAAITLTPELHRALEEIYRWFSPVGPHALAPAEVPLLFDASLLFGGESGALPAPAAPPAAAAAAAAAPPAAAAAGPALPLSLAAPVNVHRALLSGDDAADARAAAEGWLIARLGSCPPRATPDAPLLAALRAAIAGSSPVWTIAAMPRLRQASWRWLRRWCITARAAAWAQRRSVCGMTVEADTGAAAAAEIAADAATSAVQLHTHYVIGSFPRRRAPRATAAHDDGTDDEDDEAADEAEAGPSGAEAEGEADAAGAATPERSSSSSSSRRRKRCRRRRAGSSSDSDGALEHDREPDDGTDDDDDEAAGEVVEARTDDEDDEAADEAEAGPSGAQAEGEADAAGAATPERSSSSSSRRRKRRRRRRRLDDDEAEGEADEAADEAEAGPSGAQAQPARPKQHIFWSLD